MAVSLSDVVCYSYLWRIVNATAPGGTVPRRHNAGFPDRFLLANHSQKRRWCADLRCKRVAMLATPLSRPGDTRVEGSEELSGALHETAAGADEIVILSGYY